ncbi:hypothetical protein [Alkalibacillus aidingensis]|uniref:hypothetical protein n=1 Tax=Alkalibacillus aidingensis TaxID=2747607 RepID=UPI0016610AD0|nr:hypothetical protein [Alkalibacillus aidingensis]
MSTKRLDVQSFIKEQIHESKVYGSERETDSLELLQQARRSQSAFKEITRILIEMEMIGCYAKLHVGTIDEKGHLNEEEMELLNQFASFSDLTHYSFELEKALTFHDEDEVSDEVILAIGTWRQLPGIFKTIKGMGK